MPDPAPSPAPQPARPPAVAPGFVALFEQSLHAIVDPAVFRAAAARPAPSFGAAGGLAIASGAAALGAGLAHAAVESPDLFQRFSPAVVTAVAVAALGLYACVVLLTALMFHGMGNALGGKGDFDRALQAAAMLSVLWPVQITCNWFPVAWALPAAVAAWMAACALEGLYGAKPGLARALCALAAASAVGAQLAGRVLADRARQAYAATQELTRAAAATGDIAKQVQAFQQQAEAAAAALPAAGPGSVPDAAPGVPPAAGASSLDLLKGFSDDSAAPAAKGPTLQQAQQMLQSGKEVQASAIAMIDSLTPLLNNPEMTKNMTPAQKDGMKELQSLMGDLRAQIDSGQPLSDAAFQAKMQRIQQLSMQLISAGVAQRMMGGMTGAPAAAPQPAKPAGGGK